MNKISPENFQSITEKLTATIATAMENLPDPIKFLTSVVETIFEKAVREFRYAESYSQLCVTLSQALPQKDGAAFKKLLLNKCQEEFETQPREPTAADDTSGLDVEEIRARLADRNNGVPQFIGALFLHGLISEKIIHYCLRTLLTLQEPDILKFASLLTLIGKTLDHPKAKILMDAYFAKIETITQNKAISMRLRFKLCDVVDLRRNHWQSKKSMPMPPPVKSEVNKQVNLQEGR
jgi:translation initiation factor 4G